MLWDFKDLDSRPGNINGIYAYYYPNATDSASHKTPLHTATIARVTTGPGSTAGAPGARLDFVLDGKNYPSAGIGLMFPESQPLDLRMMSSIRLRLSSDKPRKIRLSLSSHDSIYQAASDSGISLGKDTIVGPEGVEWNVSALDLTWPRWAIDVPAMEPTEILAGVFAIQLNASCETKSGTCESDSGWVHLDSLRLIGVGGAWPAPTQGRSCFGDSTSVSRFQSTQTKKNGLGGWWYAFSDVGAADTNSRGHSQILSAPDTSRPDTWAPDSASDRAVVEFKLQRAAPYSGFVGVETQFGSPDSSGVPVAVNLSNLAAVSFDLEFGAFASDLGGISFHVKKAGRAFQNGKEHQIRIPYDTKPRNWCIDLDSLQQPPWTTPPLAFTPTDLLSMSWEAKLQGSAPTARGKYSISNVKIFRNNGVGIAPVSRAHPLKTRRLPGAIELDRGLSLGSGTAVLFDASGRVLGRVGFTANTRHASIPGSFTGLAWIQYRDAKTSTTIPVGF